MVEKGSGVKVRVVVWTSVRGGAVNTSVPRLAVAARRPGGGATRSSLAFEEGEDAEDGVACMEADDWLRPPLITTTVSRQHRSKHWGVEAAVQRRSAKRAVSQLEGER